MRILHVITSLRTGGAEHLMVDLLPRLRDMGNDVELLLFDGTKTTFYQQLESLGIKIHCLGIGGSVYNLVNILKLIPFLNRYDVVHTHNTAPQLFAAIGSIFCKTRLITTEHNTSNRRRKWKWFTSIDKWMYSRYKKVICISFKAEENLRAHTSIHDNSIITINNGIDVNKFVNAEPIDTIREKYKDKHLGIMVAAFRWEKDQATLIKAYSLLPEKYHLLLVGDGERREEMESYAKQLGISERVHFLGLRTDVPQLLATADVRILSSHFEGLSLSSVEGMAAGAFIASDVDGLREVVGNSGILFPHEDAATLAKEIKHLDADVERLHLVSLRCRERAMEFDISKMAINYNKVYQSL